MEDDEEDWKETAGQIIGTVTEWTIQIIIFGTIGLSLWFDPHFGAGLLCGSVITILLGRFLTWLKRENLRDMTEEERKESLTLVQKS